MSEIASRIKEVREKAGLSQKDLAERLEISRSHISQIESGTVSFSYEKLMRFSTEFSVSLDWLFFGGGSSFYDGHGREIEQREDENIVMVPKIQQKLSAGPGQEIIEDEVLEQIPVLKRFISRYPRDKIRAAEVRGDSMTGVNLFNGDIVFYIRDLIRDDGIYVLSYGGDVLVKRLEYDYINKTISLISENPRYASPKVIKADDENLHIEGKVVGWMHMHPY